MKINRLLEMTIILMNKGTVTAKELSERFSVSTRTIYRDIEALSLAGVPVYANRGTGGGISLLENYALNKTMISDKESESILFALKTLQATKYPEVDTILEKMGALFHNAATDWIQIDFLPWGADPNAYNKFEDIKKAILQGRIIETDYINASNIKTHRKIEPLNLLFKYQAWYLWGWCQNRQDYRTFRLSRMKNVSITDESFNRYAIHKKAEENRAEDQENKPSVHVVLQFSYEALYRLYDDYDDDMIRDNKDGTYTLEVDFPEDEWVYGYILSYGTYVKVLFPEHIKTIIKERAEEILKKYL